MPGILKTALVLLAVCTICASLLAAAYVVTAPIIAANSEVEVKSALSGIFPDYSSRTEAKYEADKDVDRVMTVYDAGGSVLGYAAEVSPSGFANDITMIIGISTDFKVIKIAIISISETAGIGSRVNNESYLSTYAGAGSDVNFGNGVDAISGATYSSRGVLRGVKAAITACEALYKEE